MTDDADADYIKQLETENARLRVMVNRAGVALLPPVDLPDNAQLDALMKMVETKYEALRCEGDRATYKRQFANSLYFFAHVFRTDKANTQYAVSFWTDVAREFLSKQGYGANDSMTPRPFVAAAIASGIKYELFDAATYANLGISLGSASRPSSAWRDTLRDGIAAPVEPRRPRPRHVIETNILGPDAAERIRW